MLAFESSYQYTLKSYKNSSNNKTGGEKEEAWIWGIPSQVRPKVVRHWVCGFQPLTALSGPWFSIWKLGITWPSPHGGQSYQS